MNMRIARSEGKQYFFRNNYLFLVWTDKTILLWSSLCIITENEVIGTFFAILFITKI